jgi:hypothetical protein
LCSVSLHGSADDAIWELLSDHARRDDEPARDDPAWSNVKRESAARLLEAAAGVLAATRHLVTVAEEIVEEQRDRIVAGSEPRPVDEAQPAEPQRRRERIDLTY